MHCGIPAPFALASPNQGYMLGGLPFLCGADTGARPSRVSALNLLKMLQRLVFEWICLNTAAPDWVRSSRIPGSTMPLIGAPDCPPPPTLGGHTYIIVD